MIPYEELVSALERYVARKNGTPIPASANAPAPLRAAPSAPAYAPPPPSSFDEDHDPDLPPLAQHEDHDSTHVGASIGGARPVTLAESEIDIGGVLSDE